MTSYLTIADILDRAANLIEPEGAWIQHDAIRRDDKHKPCAFCMLGAIWQAGEEVDGPSTVFLNEMLGEWPADWNDTEGRTQAEVVSALRQAAAKARGGQS